MGLESDILIRVLLARFGSTWIYLNLKYYVPSSQEMNKQHLNLGDILLLYIYVWWGSHCHKCNKASFNGLLCLSPSCTSSITVATRLINIKPSLHTQVPLPPHVTRRRYFPPRSLKRRRRRACTLSA